jgi:lipoprotein-anchoring transpeptidase ErfK/SrfK
MRNAKWVMICSVVSLFSFFMSSCATTSGYKPNQAANTNLNQTTQPKPASLSANYASRIPKTINTSEKVVVIDPRVHVWGAYDANGNLLRAGLATAGGSWCPDIGRSCHTKPGSFRVASLGSPGCKSTKFPVPRGGAPMPYCMFFNGGQGMHGSYEVVEGNISHGCVRMHVPDAEWLRYNFVNIGTKVIVRPYF